MAGSAQDVEAGRAFVRVFLERSDYDRQVDELKRDEADDRPSAAVASVAEGGLALSGSVAKIAAQGAIIRVAGDATSAAMAKVGLASAAAAPAVAATGTAAGGAAVGFGAMATAAIPIVVPLAAIAAAAGVVWVAFAKWDELPLVVKALMVVMFPLVIVVRAAVLAFKALKLAVAIVTAPFWLTTAAVRALFAAVRALPRAITATVGLMRRLATAATEMAVKVTKAAAEIPGRIASATSAALRGVGTSIARVGAVATGITAAIVGSATLAAKSWAAYGDTIRGVQNDLLKFQLTAEEASIIARVSEQTGESMERLAEQMRDGTRDFSRWRNELLLSGTLMSGPQLAAALALSRAYFSLRGSVIGLKNTVAEALGPAMLESAEIITGMVRGVTRWVSENKPLVVQVFKIASAVGLAAGVITTLGGAIAGAGTVLSPFTAALAGIAGVLTIVEVRTQAGRSIWAAYGDSVRRVAATAIQALGEMMAFADTVVGGITDALIAGDLAAAVDVMWSAVKVAWISALLEIDELTSGTFGAILQSLAAGKWAAAGESLVGVLTEVWINIVDAADTAWTGILSGFDGLVVDMKSGLSDFLGWAITNVFRPLAGAISTIPGVEVSIGKLLDAKGALDRSLDAPAGESREGPLADRRAAREQQIAALRERQAELANQSGEEAARAQTANQKALDASLAAAQAAREAADSNKLVESDFAVSQEVQSIARFSGEALGLSVGRGENAAQRQVKLAEEQLKETREMNEELARALSEIIRLQTMGGFV